MTSTGSPGTDIEQCCADEGLHLSDICSTEKTYLFLKPQLLTHLFESLSVPLGLVSLAARTSKNKEEVIGNSR